MESTRCEICSLSIVEYLLLKVGGKIFLCAECNADMNEELEMEVISNVQILIPKGK